MAKTTTQKPLTTTVQLELKSLKKQINEGHETIEAMKAKMKGYGNTIITEAILEGDRLAKAKKLVAYGSFVRWLKDNCKNISVRTAQRYMTLATHKTQLLTTDVGLREAYALAGIIKDDDIIETPMTPQPKLDKVVTTTGHGLSMAIAAANKARAGVGVLPVIQKDDALSRARYLAGELLNELNSKLIINLIVKDDARQIVKPLIGLCA